VRVQGAAKTSRIDLRLPSSDLFRYRTAETSLRSGAVASRPCVSSNPLRGTMTKTGVDVARQGHRETAPGSCAPTPEKTMPDGYLGKNRRPSDVFRIGRTRQSQLAARLLRLLHEQRALGFSLAPCCHLRGQESGEQK
jgi:hypothetical protein